MFKPFRTAAVLGAGIMGTQIAAHLANAGLIVHLLDVPAAGDHKNKIVETAFKKALKQSPPIFFTENTAQRVILGNFDEHFHRLGEVDWVIEAVVENLGIKQQLMERLEGVIRDDAVIATNTSGLPIHLIAQGRSPSFCQRFLGTHFFNPPRYLKLLELIPTASTDPQVVERLRWFGRLHLGKGVVMAKDTPGFIANRIGMFVTMLGLRAWTDGGYTIEEVDTLTGTLVGRAKSATFRTADLVGLDTLLYVAQHLHQVLGHDEARQVFQPPAALLHLVETGSLGVKAGQGFYKKQGRQILSVNPQTWSYEPAQPLNLEQLEQIQHSGSLGDRLQALYHDQGRAGAFFRQQMLAVLSYSACRIPEIADNPDQVDQAMRWGFGWELGPFQLWDVLGFDRVLADLEAAGLTVPAWVKQVTGGFYQRHQTPARVMSFGGMVPLNQPDDDIDLDALKADPAHTLWHNPEAALLDLGDGVGLFEFRSKGNTLSLKVVTGLSQVLDQLEQGDLRGLVIGNGGSNFSAGANLAEMGMMAQAGNLDGLGDLLDLFQTLMQRIQYFPKPIVGAVQGLALGGGCELVMACPHVVAAAESYIGLVELSVGLIPGAGGLMRMAVRAADRAASQSSQHIRPFLQKAFETVGMAKVAGSAQEAKELGFLAADAQIVMNGDRRLYVAKQEVLRLDREGYLPPPRRNAVMVLGQPARAAMEMAAYIMQQSGFISDYDRYLAGRLAYVITGGDLTAPALVDETYLLRLERETFLPLLQQPKTHERIAHMLQTKKPLRN